MSQFFPISANQTEDKSKVLDAFFGTSRTAQEEVTEVIRLYGAEEAAERTSHGVLCDDYDDASFIGVSPRLILSSWRRVGII